MLLIVGRTCTGKDTLARELEKYGMKSVVSYTTRPKRYESEDTHIFITQKEAEEITNKVATTVLNGYEYFTTRTQLENCDIYIIDPKGLQELITNCPDDQFNVVHVTADQHISKTRAIQRSHKEHESEVFDSRTASEDMQFTNFEKIVQDTDRIAENCKIIYHYENDFTVKSLHKAVKRILNHL